MAREGEERGDKERGEGFDDLFEDLDRFFAPDAAEGGRRPRRSTGPDRPAGPSPEDAVDPEAGDGAADERDEGKRDEAEEPRADEVLPAGWRPDIGGLDERDQAEVEEGGPRAGEMNGQDWTRLRDVLGEEEEAEEEEFAYMEEIPDAPADEPRFGDEDAGETGEPDWLEPGSGHELTLEDMKKPPPEYRDLPRPTDEELAEERAAAPSGPPEPPEDARAAEPAEASEPAEPTEQAEPGEPAWAEPNIAEVEAAADQLAEEFRESESAAEVEQDLLSDLEEESQGPRTVRVGAAESLTGPTWEEPTSRPLMAEPAPPAPGAGPSRNMIAAVGTAAVLAVVALAALLIAKVAFVVVAGIVILEGQFELYLTMQKRGHQPATALGLAVGAFTLAGAYRRGEPAMMFFVILGLVLSFLWYMAAPLKARENLIRNIGATMLGILYVPVLAGYVFLLLAQPNAGRSLMLVVIGLAFIYDIAAYAFGSFWGSRPLAPTISPRKSWEGLFGATVVTFALGIVLVPTLVSYLSVTKAIGLGIVVVVFAPLGDLFESLIKRDLGVKDMGSILPGHGGVLDRIDSVLLVAPAAFYYIRLVF